MNDNSLDTIRSGIDFLLRFRKLPRVTQDFIEPHLAQPMRTALKVINCCSAEEGQSAQEIGAIANLHPESTRQVLNVLEGALVESERGMVKLWRLK